jgi:hypothetical protein
MRTCGATPGGPSLAGIDLSKQTVIQGVIVRDGQSILGDAVGVPNGAPVERAHVRLLDSSGEFTAEVPTNTEGQFRFFAAPGSWTLVVQAPRGRVEQSVIAAQGTPVDLVISL